MPARQTFERRTDANGGVRKHGVKSVNTIRKALSLAGVLTAVCGCMDSLTGVGGPQPYVRVATGTATSLGPTLATLNATVDPGGVQTSCFFELGTTTSYGTRTAIHDAGTESGPVAVSATVQGLTPGTVYHFRAVAVVRTSDTTRGEDRTFSTILAAPVVTLTDVRGLSAASVGLYGTVNPMGLSTSYHFDYGPTSAYGHSTSQQDAGSGKTPVVVGATIGNLAPPGSYHWRLVAINVAGTTATADSTFNTPRGFVIPLNVGTTWNYQFYDGSGDDGKLLRRGFHTWAIVSKSITGTDTTLQIRDIEADSLQVWAGHYYPSTYQVDTLYFTIVMSADSMVFNFPEPREDAFHPAVPAVPRYSLQRSDTLAMPIFSGVTKYANHVGLIQYAFKYWTGGIASGFAEFDLISVLIK